MDERVEKTLTTMLDNRGFVITNKETDHWTVHGLNEFRVYFITSNQRIGIAQIKPILRDCKDHNIDHIILIGKQSLTSFAEKELATDDMDIEFFLEKELIVNITKHAIQPKFELIQEKAQILRIMDELNVTRSEFPRILRSDPISRYFHAKPGNLFKIYRPDTISYRLVA